MRRASRTDEEHDKLIMKDDEHYQILGLDDFKIVATEDQIKIGYKKMALKYHPDKKNAGKKAAEAAEKN